VNGAFHFYRNKSSTAIESTVVKNELASTIKPFSSFSWPGHFTAINMAGAPMHACSGVLAHHPALKLG